MTRHAVIQIESLVKQFAGQRRAGLACPLCILPGRIERLGEPLLYLLALGYGLGGLLGELERLL